MYALSCRLWHVSCVYHSPRQRVISKKKKRKRAYDTLEFQGFSRIYHCTVYRNRSL
ncbi:hypothetical protein B0F90DRAFT_1745959 [Multifurca ochricompacta]|uniref:Uncharacterized protein n=1 Tax=Multifurca ochricompacta TaxID=376703 RepID=A0AAD4M071_9AGAM|nr:hypothetical protein B0F90DRAFT_1745959 [Multifurca ochricompacta]